MTRFLLPCVWIAWGLSYPLMSWSLDAVDLFDINEAQYTT